MPLTASEEPYQGVMGNGLQPNLQNMYRGTKFYEKYHLTNYNCNQGGYVEQFLWKTHVSYPVEEFNNITINTPNPLNVGIIHRDVETPGGFFLGNASTDFLIENVNITYGDTTCIVVGGDCTLLWQNNIECN
jgi:hypothetical protein